MTLPTLKHPRHFILLLCGLFISAVSMALAQSSTSVAPTAEDRQRAWESIESPENTDFWSTLLSSDRAITGDPSPDRTIAGSSAVAQRLLHEYFVKAAFPEGKEGPEKTGGPEVSVVVNEDGSIEYDVEGARGTEGVQGNAGGADGSSDQESCGGN